jgi:hypothetical protein
MLKQQLLERLFLVLRSTVVCLYCASLHWGYCLVVARFKEVMQPFYLHLGDKSERHHHDMTDAAVALQPILFHFSIFIFLVPAAIPLLVLVWDSRGQAQSWVFVTLLVVVRRRIKLLRICFSIDTL